MTLSAAPYRIIDPHVHVWKHDPHFPFAPEAKNVPAVDRTLLRIGVFELLWVDEIDDPVAITEAVELARTLSTDDSPRFLNGVLGRISDIAEHLRATL